MKPLNRPMFRMGGPIKEGIMSGIQEPRQGYKRGKIVSSILSKIPGGQKIISGTKDIIPRTIDRIKNFYRTPPSTSKDLVVYDAGIAAKRNPAFLTNRYLFEKGVKPVAGVVSKTAKGVFPYTGVGTLAVGGGLGAYNFLKGDPNVPPPNAGTGRQFTGDEAMVGDPRQPLPDAKLNKKTGAGAEMSPEERRAKRVERYRDIMDIKGMNKKAAYDSLIEASRLINESGDFKGDIKSGRLINQIIGATSKAFDKPAQTKDAIDTLILKGEIEKDIKASDPSNEILNKLRAGQLQKINKELEGNTFAEAKAVMRKAGSKGQAEITDAAKSLEGVDYQGTIISKSDFKEVIDVAKNTAKQEGGTLSEE